MYDAEAPHPILKNVTSGKAAWPNGRPDPSAALGSPQGTVSGKVTDEQLQYIRAASRRLDARPEAAL